MPWTFEEIQQEWFGGEYLQMDRDDVERAFAEAEKIRGKEWVLGQEFDLAGLVVPGIGRRGGWMQFLRVYWFGKRIQSIIGSPGAERLTTKLLAEDRSADSELSAIHLLRARHSDTELELEPEVEIGDRTKVPDFRIRKDGDEWTYAEVTQLNRSTPSARTQELLDRIATAVMAIDREFILEIVLWRELGDEDEIELLAAASDASQLAYGQRKDLGDFASVLVKSGDPSVVIPSILENDGVTRMALSRALVGPGQPNRQIVVRAPFADERAEDILRTEARQLPKDASGLVIVDVGGQPTALESWSRLIPPRFTPKLYTRVGGVLLFTYAQTLTDHGPAWLPYVRLIVNPHARIPLPDWIKDAVERTRAESGSLTARP
jgi:hypothetical protein